ncbi:MAG: AEC family transporter [Beijerinckiaceae bacterium]
MMDTLGIVFPIFAIIAFGYLAAWIGLLGEKTADGLSDFVFVIAIPILLFRTLAAAPLPEAQPWFYWLAFFSSLAVVWAATTLIGARVFGLKGREGAIAGFSAAQANTVFIGIPLVLRVHGEAGAVPLSLLIAVHLPITMTAATLLVERAEGGKADLREMALKLVTHPLLIGIGLGVLWRMTGLPLPAPALSVAKLIGDSAGPVALFALGMTLRRYGGGAPLGLVGVMAFLKLMALPALVYVMAFHVLPMPPLWASVAVLFAACPSGVNGYLLAQRYRTGVALASSAIAVSTLCAVVTMTFWVFVATGRP